MFLVKRYNPITTQKNKLIIRYEYLESMLKLEETQLGILLIQRRQTRVKLPLRNMYFLMLHIF